MAWKLKLGKAREVMQLVEQHVISRVDSRFAPIDAMAFQAKNLYNAALYEVRQAFIFQSVYLSYPEMSRRMKTHDAYRALPAKVAQWVLRLLDKNWQSYFAACGAYRDDPSSFVGRPKMPRYKHKTDGRYVLVYTIQALSRPGMRAGLIQPSRLPITIQTNQTCIAQVRIVPRSGFYVVEVVYEQQEAAPSGNPALYAAVDIGVDNLVAITSNKKGFVPRLVNGRPIKSTNQYYNKRRAELQEAGLGRVNNQHFVGLPHARFIQMLEYKGKLAGIRVLLQEESYTSKASFLDGDPIPTYDPHLSQPHTFSGKRVKRGLYRARDGRTVNADVNGSYNILCKALPDAWGNWGKGIEALVVAPVWLTFAWSVQPGALAAA